MEPGSLIDRWWRHDAARLVSAAVLATVAGLIVTIFATHRRGGAAFGSPIGADFGQFYVAGTILNEGRADRLYDLADQDRRLHELAPGMAAEERLPFIYPPFLAGLTRPLARLPFAGSYAAWLALAAGTYASAVALTLRRCGSLTGPERTTAWLLALSFAPFAIECGIGGQLSSLGALAIAVALAFDGAGRPVASGLALSILLYKPTLLVLIGPMLVVGRCWRMLAGFAMGASALMLASVLVADIPGCVDYWGLLVDYGRVGGSVGPEFKTLKFVDLTAFLRLLGLGREAARTSAIALGLLPSIALIVIWAGTRRGRPSDLSWAAALCWTPLLNVYGPIYDVTMVVPGVLLAADHVRREHPDVWPPTFLRLLAFLYLSALMSQALALKAGFQPLTVALAAFGVSLLRRSLRDWRAPGVGRAEGVAALISLDSPLQPHG